MQSYDYDQRQGVEEVSWEQFAQLAAALTEKLAGLETIIGIARARLFGATAVARAGSCTPSVSPVATIHNEQR